MTFDGITDQKLVGLVPVDKAGELDAPRDTSQADGLLNMALVRDLLTEPQLSLEGPLRNDLYLLCQS